jgi:hypothetical protein
MTPQSHLRSPIAPATRQLTAPSPAPVRQATGDQTTKKPAIAAGSGSRFVVYLLGLIAAIANSTRHQSGQLVMGRFAK